MLIDNNVVKLSYYRQRKFMWDIWLKPLNEVTQALGRYLTDEKTLESYISRQTNT